jgi:DNA-binding MltR family transcriptional regulator
MSDSIKKWEEMNEQSNTYTFTSSNTISTTSFQDSVKKEAYTILAKYNEAAILKAAEILQKVIS